MRCPLLCHRSSAGTAERAALLETGGDKPPCSVLTPWRTKKREEAQSVSSSYFAFPRKQRAMSTGDVGGNLRQLQQDLRALRYPAPFDERLYVARARAPPPLRPALGP